MDKKALKKQLWEECIALEKERMTQLQHEIDEAQRLANEYGAPKDRYDPYRTKLMLQHDLFARQLAKAEQLMTALLKVPIEKDFERVDFGALVITEQQKLFVSAAIGKIDFQGESYYAISPLVPVYKAMEGKTTGDSFQVNTHKFKIIDVY